MIKRPLAVFSVVFIMVLLLFQIIDDSIVFRNPVGRTSDGEKELSGFRQDEGITLYGVVSDYSYKDDYGYITTELILKDVHILIPIEEQSDNLNNNSTFTLDNEAWKKVSSYGQSIITYLNKEETVSIGNTVLLSGKLSFFEAATNPGQFDAAKYYGNKDVLFSVKNAFLVQKTNDQAILRQWLKKFGIKQQAKLEEYLSASNATIMKAMLFGNKEELDEEIKELYQDNGIAHVLAISGLHISLLGMAVYRLLQRLPVPVWIPLVLSELFLIVYGLMVGFSSSAFRAIGMFAFFLLSKIIKRSYDMITALAFTAFLQLLIHPGYLFDCSFQLSYAAILGIGILLPALEKINKSIPYEILAKGISFLLPSLSVTLVTAPILIWHYHEISFFSILLNVIVIPFMSALLLCAIAMLFFANLFVPLAKLFAVPVTLILGLYEYSCRFLELLPVGQMNVASPPVVVLLLYFILLFLMTRVVKKKSHPYQFLFVGISVILLFFPQNPQFTVWITDVGQGDCSVIFTERGKCFIIDCGSTSEYHVGERILIPFLKYHGVKKVDAVFVTHADADHMNGVIELLELGEEENISIARVVLYEKALETEPTEWEELVVAAKESGIPIVGMEQGEAFQTDSVTLTCLYPLKEQSGLTGNASSLVLSLETEAFRALFTGDLETVGEEFLLKEYGIAKNKESISSEIEVSLKDFDLLKVGHHGSSGSSSGDFLERVNPKVATISCGENNSYGHPHKETLERLEKTGCTVLATSEHGAIAIEMDKEMKVYGATK